MQTARAALTTCMQTARAALQFPWWLQALRALRSRRCLSTSMLTARTA